MTSQQLLLQSQLRIRLTPRHIYSHEENVGSECADHAAALGALGFVSNHNVTTRLSHSSSDITNLVRGCNSLDEIQLCFI